MPHTIHVLTLICFTSISTTRKPENHYFFSSFVLLLVFFGRFLIAGWCIPKKETDKSLNKKGNNMRRMSHHMTHYLLSLSKNIWIIDISNRESGRKNYWCGDVCSISVGDRSIAISSCKWLLQRTTTTQPNFQARSNRQTGQHEREKKTEIFDQLTNRTEYVCLPTSVST